MDYYPRDSKQARRYEISFENSLWEISVANRGRREGRRAATEAVILVGSISG